MSDVEALSYVRATLAKFRGVMSGTTYQRLCEAIQTAHGESDSLKSRIGGLISDLEIATNKIASLESECQVMRASLEAKSITEVDTAIIAEQSIEAAKGSENESPIAAVENNALAQ